MLLVLSPKRVAPRVSQEILGDLNVEVLQPVPHYLPAPTHVSPQNNQLINLETITSHLRSVSQNSRRYPQDSDSDGPQPPPKRFFRPRKDMRNDNKVPDNEEEEEEEDQYCD
ncbi:hypothetical protein O181_103922 [Austropuccinia psidii MF-1]|uniref:Uncharacterized protein n=1 Tax=Austropuccinia psidii MF-1 TaxID=1389203 RepID=A0A9Q3JKN4_9BASI|nr:hypothetical protein [Austropuccinia psidii MF-1]